MHWPAENLEKTETNDQKQLKMNFFVNLSTPLEKILLILCQKTKT